MRGLFVGGSDGNARLTAATGVVLLVLLAAEGLTLVFGVGSLLLPHIFIGLLLIPPILLKVGSTSWRMVAYYRHVEEYVRKGPPNILLRILIAPVLVAATVVMFATGIAAALVGHGGLLLGLHKTSFIVWGIAFGVHVLGHLLELPRLVTVDWWRSDRLGGRRLRQYVLAFALVAGLVIAVMAWPLTAHWQHGFGGD
ncbi:MAG: hypothetical protein QOI82_3557 [Actinomycetota bacterium]|nr:hypothetical protein [Actinomycetota bacterium]